MALPIQQNDPVYDGTLEVEKYLDFVKVYFVSPDVEVVTFDELLEKLRQLSTFLHTAEG